MELLEALLVEEEVVLEVVGEGAVEDRALRAEPRCEIAASCYSSYRDWIYKS